VISLQVTRLTVGNFDDLCHVLGRTTEVGVRLSSDEPTGTILRASVGDVLVTAAQLRADIRARGCLESSRICMAMKLDSQSRHFSFRQGREFLAGDVSTLQRGNYVDYRVSGDARYAFVSVEPSFLLRQCGEDALRRDKEFWHERCSFRAPSPVRGFIVRSVDRVVTWLSQPQRTLTKAAVRQLQGDLFEPFMWGLMLDEGGVNQPSAVPAAAMVRRVEDWVDGRAPETIQIADLCGALHVTRRTLQRAFTTTLGMGPAQYLTRRRLTAVRAALRESDPRSTTIADTAMRYGFWELGRFAKSYRAMFGERPSQTLAKSLRSSVRLPRAGDDAVRSFQ